MCSTWSVDLGKEAVQRQCLCATNEAVWWVSTAGVLYTWRGNTDTAAEEVPDPMALLQLDSRAQFMAMSADDRILLVTSHHLSLFAISRESAPLFLHGGGGDAGQPSQRQENDGDYGEHSEKREVVITVEEVQRLPCRLSEVRGGDINCDASCAALCSAFGLYVVDCAPSTAEVSAAHGDRVGLYECSQLGASTRGCRFACFSGVTQLVVLDEANHLLLLRCDCQHETYANGYRDAPRSESSPAVEVLVDGHVLTRTARATALACSHSTLHAPTILVGFSSGQVRVMDGESLQQLRTWDVSSVLPSRTPTSAAAVTVTERSRRRTGGASLSRPPRGALTALALSDDDPLPKVAAPPLPVLDAQVGVHLFTIVTPNGVLYYNRHTFQLHETYVSRFERPVVQMGAGVAHATVEEQVVFRSAPNGSWCYTNVLEGILYYAPTCVDAQHAAERRDMDEELATTDLIHARVPLPSSWLGTDGPAKREPSVLSPKTTKRTSSSALPTTMNKAGGNVPVRRPVKGSNYNDAPWSVQQERKRKAQAAAAKDRAAQEFGLPPTSAANSLRFHYNSVDGKNALNLPYAFERMEAPTSALCHLHTRAVLAATFDTVGEALVTAGGDGSAQHLQYPVARVKRTGDVVGYALSGHPAAVTTVDANLSRQHPMVLTGCADGKLRLWIPGSQDTPVTEVATGPANEKAGDAPNAVTNAQFFYLDKFVLSCTKDRLELRRHAAPVTSIATSPSPSRLSKTPVYSHTVGAGHTVTSASAMNHFASHLVVLATSEKAIQVLDVSTDAILWSNGATHTRAVYRVAMGRSSRHAATMPSSLAHLFASAALDSTVALWDVRTPSPAQLYTQHSNTAIPSLGMELSPGNEMVAVASQDNRVYVYDIRKGGGGGATASTVLQGFATYVTSIAWHPLQPIMAAGLANGDVQLYHHRG
ncbi:hypothetical protein ABB37_02936 [Leptomonas pyrrhocoris]|uniref:Guanine nucleotide-binding protein subunit beta-like protein n=1 Tax=Leptomonas pyrrhocoris TaxID=157538 RepID=A0A0M9G6H3_LEPPY|nr:hypothetical protein ABB37_02936 [Leptomonas pyrrhocoris]XP_015661698.1 hypothetical protein ABB37_02936 [Leptomonas pyrrhocoris]KPA83258.1 hypothetical protein ABB37_02936 [Leptomonas pyrrhocoris]KPA83259.1 hypothetical protein ABB37_02936 [Leptomonas pyrrhocoris]|eukprot:XP_015661697.1 hypothetical protein ABB37_02936 [Leptomonas pyrrhocoris]